VATGSAGLSSPPTAACTKSGNWTADISGQASACSLLAPKSVLGVAPCDLRSPPRLDRPRRALGDMRPIAFTTAREPARPAYLLGSLTCRYSKGDSPFRW
jgi:hypothetical protein